MTNYSLLSFGSVALLLTVFCCIPLTAQYQRLEKAVVEKGGINAAQFEEILMYCDDLSVRTGYPMPALVGMAVEETGYFTSRLCREGNNLFGIMALRDWEGKPKIWQSHSVYNKRLGQFEKKAMPFRSYGSYGESIYDLAIFLAHPRYAALRKTTNARDFLYAVSDAGYAEDGSYANKIIGLLERYNLLNAEFKVYNASTRK